MEPGAKVAKPVVVLVPGRDRYPEETRAGAAETAAKAMVAETAAETADPEVDAFYSVAAYPPVLSVAA
jgi:hypothetical protein